MKLRLTAPGWETYTGQMGVIFFEDGLSVSDVLPVDAVRVAGVIGAEWEDGRPANVSQIYLDNANTPAPTIEHNPAVEAATEAWSEKVAETVVKLGEALEAIREVKLYTQDELAAIADASGVTGLRKIAEPLGIKSNSIRGLIDGILKVAGAPKAE